MILPVLSLVLLVTCKPSPSLSLKDNKQKQIIAIQPFGDYDELMLDYLAHDIRDFYNKETIVLKSIEIPGQFYNSTIKQYSADSLILFLSKLQKDSIAEVVGVTHKAVFTIKKDDLASCYDLNIFGMGHQPGNSCIVSDFTFRSVYESLYHLRLRKVIIHEIGHNLGLSHCENEKCIMSEKNGSTIALDNSSNDYCQKCRDILYK